jgi:hypothetical protein
MGRWKCAENIIDILLYTPWIHLLVVIKVNYEIKVKKKNCERKSHNTDPG